MRYAAIDIGSNAVRLLIADVIQNNKTVSFKKNTLIRVPLRLGDDAFLDKLISPNKTEELIKTMVAFRNLIDVYKVSDYMACATSAMREARNGSSLVAKIKAEAGLDLEIVEGQREANIIYASHIEQSLDRKKNYLYIDVGGGSTELSVFSNGELISSRSFNLGGIRILDNQDKDETWAEMKDWVKNVAQSYKNLSGIGTGGNINKLFKMAEGKDGSPLTFTKLRELYSYLNSFSLKDRINVLGLNQDRADVIIPATEIYLTVMKWGGVKQIFVPRVGLVDGIIQLLIDKNFPD
ncbi:MAG: exopolyphosphatase [Sphingobacteriales bacterium 17-39-43]|uniref:Ppx/GppA phosphatase family protein n=1 Tax=Daejeonella sp. TaxID=2805397 RepID=UPI000BCFD059|nr:exopolyphosphatase [Daejeonella sp.]OYX91584.1 MAG: exopolyphosphatase [Sphingobacteriia bacterium 35-40-5]OYZ30550.1 MAG: exopolyphosphatase [Sphingobacteriales bacterium 16-39-50]OZA23196.1 MAG: exopolyphosphatase [Sphingobacteriales bacterium 17-39-43]HQT24051.1 ethanolamine ammonia-lyase reactivating factor EutA [Daejeonella sp.]HQT58889.1 ethanolamine ammonia-lyase reactivating factor EutA [Daejeonella sp.]